MFDEVPDILRRADTRSKVVAESSEGVRNE